MDDETRNSQFVEDRSDRPAEEAGPGTEETSQVAVAEVVGPAEEGAAAAEQPSQNPAPPDLLHELAAAMHATAARERERIDVQLAERSSARVDKLRERAKAESDELRRLADEDVERIDQRAAAEIDRIRLEARRRTDERRTALEGYLRRHDDAVEDEVGRVAKAVAIYRERLDAFFREVEATSDPGAIARLAGSLPEVPDLEDLDRESKPGAAPEPSLTMTEALSTSTVASDDEAMKAENAAAEEARAELEVDHGEDASTAQSEPAPPKSNRETPLVGVMASSPPAPVSPLTAIVSGPPASGATSARDERTATKATGSSEASDQPQHRGALELLRTIAPWSRHDDRDATGASHDTND